MYTKIKLFSNRQHIKRNALVDSGSRKNLINYETFVAFNGRNAPKIYKKSEESELHSASGGTLKSVGHCKILTTVGTKQFYLEYEILSNLCVGIIIGEEGLHQMKATLDFSGQKPVLTFPEGEIIHLSSFDNTKDMCNLVLSEDIYIPANSYNIGKAKTTSNTFDGDFIFTTNNKNKVSSFDGLINIKKRSTKIPLLNETNNSFTIKAGQILGHIKSVDSQSALYMTKDTVYSLLSQSECNPVVTKQNMDGPGPSPKRKKKLKSNPQPTKFPDATSPYENMSDEEIIDKKLDLSKSRLSNDEKIRMRNIILKHREAFSLRGEIGCVNNFEYDIKLKNNPTHIFRQPFQISDEQERMMRAVVEKLVRHGIISKNKSLYVPWLSPCLLTCKRSGAPRLVIDFRSLNRELVYCPSSFATIQGLFKKIGKILDGGSGIYSTLEREIVNVIS